MVNNVNLGLDLDRLQDAEPAARVCIALACSYTKGVGAPTVTKDCKTFHEFEQEIDRLKDELDALSAEAKVRMGASSTRRVDSPKQQSGEADGDSSDHATRGKDRLRLDCGLFVRDLMTHPVKTLAPNDKVSVVDELMKVGNFRHVVVVEDGGAVAGVVSHRDIIFSALEWSMGQGLRAHDAALETFTAKEVMHSPVVSIDPDVPVAEAAELMQSRKIGCLPVVRDEKLIGILTDGDFLALLSRS